MVNGITSTVTKLANVQTPPITGNVSLSVLNSDDRISDTEDSISDSVSQAEVGPGTVPDQFDETLLETIPMNLTVSLSNLGGGVSLRWGVLVGSQQATGFEYRYKPTVFADTRFTAWQSAPGGSEAREVTVPGNLINNVEYMFEGRSIGSGSVDIQSYSMLYQHRVKDCLAFSVDALP